MGARRTIPGNGHVTTAVVFGPDRHSLALASSMAIANNTFSPMAVGVHDPGGSRKGFVGDRGYGVNRMTGRTLPLQHFASAIAPIQTPVSRRVGIGAGPAGQPGLPNTGMDAGGLGPLQWLGYGQLGQRGMGM